jgi:hypothetical protein
MKPPKEKAEELYQKFYNNYGYYGMPADAIIHSKKCALIAVDEIIEIIPKNNGWESILDYWKEVRNEI